MKKLFYVLCMSALIFTGCKKSSSPGADGGDGSSSRDIIKAYCEINPQKRPCPDIANGTEISPEEGKPVMKLTLSGSEILYGAADPVAWDKGFSNVDSTQPTVANFSVEDGSIISVGEQFTIFVVSPDLVEVRYIASPDVTDTLGGDTTMGAFAESWKGAQAGRVAVSTNSNSRKYMYLPMLHLLP